MKTPPRDLSVSRQNANRLAYEDYRGVHGELMKAVWGDTIVEESNLTQSVFLLRKALSTHSSTENKIIITVPGRGYRFAAQVECLAMPSLARAAPETAVGQLPAAAKLPHSDRRYRQWFIMGVLVGATAIAGLIVFLGGARRQHNKPVPLPHRLTANAVENPVTNFAIAPNGKYLAYTDAHSITIQALPSGETRSIPLGPGVVPSRVIW